VSTISILIICSPFFTLCPILSFALWDWKHHIVTHIHHIPVYSKFQCWYLYDKTVCCIHRLQLRVITRGGLIIHYSTKGTCEILCDLLRKEGIKNIPWHKSFWPI
jgi:hypothetical protein